MCLRPLFMSVTEIMYGVYRIVLRGTTGIRTHIRRQKTQYFLCFARFVLIAMIFSVVICIRGLFVLCYFRNSGTRYTNRLHKSPSLPHPVPSYNLPVTVVSTAEHRYGNRYEGSNWESNNEYNLLAAKTFPRNAALFTPCPVPFRRLPFPRRSSGEDSPRPARARQPSL